MKNTERGRSILHRYSNVIASLLDMIMDNQPRSRQHQAEIERPMWVVVFRPLRLPGPAVGQGRRGEGEKAGKGRCGESVVVGSNHTRMGREEGRRDMDEKIRYSIN